MKIIEKKIENWCKDARFVNFANRRMHQEITERLENGSYDALFEELDEAFDYDDRYIEPLVEYLTCRLHIAKLNKDLEAWGRKMVLLFPDETQYKKYHEKDFPGLPSTIIYGFDTHGAAEQIAREMKLRNKSSLPIFIITDTFNRVVFVSQGYTIGLGEQLMRTVRGL